MRHEKLVDSRVGRRLAATVCAATVIALIWLGVPGSTGGPGGRPGDKLLAIKRLAAKILPRRHLPRRPPPRRPPPRHPPPRHPPPRHLPASRPTTQNYPADLGSWGHANGSLRYPKRKRLIGCQWIVTRVGSRRRCRCGAIVRSARAGPGGRSKSRSRGIGPSEVDSSTVAARGAARYPSGNSQAVAEIGRASRDRAFAGRGTIHGSRGGRRRVRRDGRS